ncbi:hypothetical protein BaRGS_00032560 [Batillaria attramentaria]|uniref:EF-hand domain-containing protein n=1 Tax=Batillaria attramentaria TaxID=370345 RepID=A0ABD0JNC4_9CAEN
MYKQKRKDGITITPDVEFSRTAVRTMMQAEERMSLEKDKQKLKKETERIMAQIDSKYGMSQREQGPDLITLADQYYHGNAPDRDGLTEEVRRELTQDEIRDLKMVFDMFDVKGRGYITANDVKRAASMLGFKAKKEVFKEMITEVTGGHTSRISFLNFLQFVIKGQGQGPDPLEDIMQGFRLLDTDQKGYVTAADLRQASDSQKLSLSNRAIREMIQEADLTGDNKISPEEFVHIMLQCSMFKSSR